MRLFVALDLPDSLRASLAAWRLDLPDARWTPPERMHLTLRFLGETTEVRRDAITEELTPLVAAPVPLAADRLVRLPSARRPRVLAVRFAESPELSVLHARVDAALRAAGAPPADRPLLPHVTLVRFQSPDPARIRRALRSAAAPAVEGVARSVSLVRSERGEAGPTYTALLRLPLG